MVLRSRVKLVHGMELIRASGDVPLSWVISPSLPCRVRDSCMEGKCASTESLDHVLFKRFKDCIQQ